jgi:hypothetical protein
MIMTEIVEVTILTTASLYPGYPPAKNALVNS